MAPETENLKRNIESLVFPNGTLPKNRTEGEAGLLMEAFEMFARASSSLEISYSQLQEKVQKLTEELEAKNLELEKSLEEKEEAQNYLHNILERLPCGVLVFDEKENLALFNPMAAEVLAGSRTNHLPDLDAEIRVCLAESVAWNGKRSEIEFPIEQGGKQKVLASSGAPLMNSTGVQTGTLHIIRDITEMKTLQEQNKRVERLSAMGEMAVELAHEIRNPLGSVELFASLLEKEGTGDLKRWAENIRIGTQSLNNIVSNMLHFANPLSPEFTRVNLHEIIGDVIGFTDPIMHQRKVRLDKRLKADHPVISADSELLKQLILNLVMNAMNAMPSEGSLMIQTGNSSQVPGEGEYLELKIRDSGVGIPPENLKRIFDPFFTTNKKGTGLGLSVVHQIVEQHGGNIQVKSEINRGTTFTINFKVESQKQGEGLQSKE
jgi:signal transduction histidine kinase